MEEDGRSARSLKGSWKAALAALKRHDERHAADSIRGREIFYFLDIDRTLAAQALTLEIRQRQRRASGEWGKLKTLRIGLGQINDLLDPIDRQVVSLLAGGRVMNPYGWVHPGAERLPDFFRLSLPLAELALPLLGTTGRLRLYRSSDDDDGEALTWDAGEPWRLVLEVQGQAGDEYALGAALRRGEERMTLEEPSLLIAGGFVFAGSTCARLDDGGAFGWISILRVEKRLRIPAAEIGPFLAELFLLPHRPAIDLPEELHWQEVEMAPRPRLAVRPGSRPAAGAASLTAELSFDYAGRILKAGSASGDLPDADERQLILRDKNAERAAAERLVELGLKPPGGPDEGFTLTRAALPGIARTLVAENWHVEAQGKLLRTAGRVGLSVTTGIDWFELRGTVSYGDQTVALPELLAALAREDGMVVLGDGSFGVLPEEWLEKHAPLAALGRRTGDHLVFGRAQITLLDMLLAEQPEGAWDEAASRARAELKGFDGVQPTAEPEGFRGLLRDYQREGLGWFGFLERFGFGGCLADDMGLGKTVQVLALLQARRALPGAARARPSLVVAPRSLVFNWQEEAARFSPDLRFVDHTGIGRHAKLDGLSGRDVLITTYGTLRRDALLLSKIEFDYAILDEAQAIKNDKTQVAKAARLLRADHRLALSGTPIENHLGELWSLFEFLNPGMLGRSAAFRKLGGEGRDPDLGSRGLLARALRPFILRRTKGQVARELPEKVEQTIHCEMEPKQRRLYVELQDHYRRSLGEAIEVRGMASAKFQVLEALLRLRQAACHPGLIDPKRRGESSAKFDALLPQLAEVIAEGHKALVFSQFTSLLALVRERLDAEGTPYSYLDGRTRDRAARVDRFQNDPACKLFLISLKAGGLGLNLTAAEYVFLLDPWWNPAVEAQAVDRAHRIGQTNRVFAYRLVTRDTVEEKILALQQGKRELADAIIRADDAPLANLTREELWSLLA